MVASVRVYKYQCCEYLFQLSITIVNCCFPATPLTWVCNFKRVAPFFLLKKWITLQLSEPQKWCTGLTLVIENYRQLPDMIIRHMITIVLMPNTFQWTVDDFDRLRVSYASVVWMMWRRSSKDVLFHSIGDPTRWFFVKSEFLCMYAGKNHEEH